MDLDLAGMNVVVTGGSAGIGAALVERFAQEGANVAFCSRSAANVERMLAALETYPVRRHGKVLDVTDREGFSEWLATLGKVDIFIPNVSAISADWAASVATDLEATVQCTEAAIPFLRQSSRPAITYIGSKAATFATPGFEAYGAMKAALTHYMKSLGKRLLPDGIRVNTVSPGDTFVEGGFWDRMKSQLPEVYQATLAANPLGRFGTPREVADAVVFLSSPLASFICGSHLLVDGGATDHVHG